MLNELNAEGFDMTLAGLKSALQRIPAERKGMRADASADTSVSNMATSADAGRTNAATSEYGLRESMAKILARRLSRGSHKADKTGSD